MPKEKEVALLNDEEEEEGPRPRPRFYLVCAMFGFAGAGKTVFRRHFLKLDPIKTEKTLRMTGHRKEDAQIVPMTHVDMEITCIDVPGMGDHAYIETTLFPLVKECKKRLNLYNRKFRQKEVGQKVRYCFYFLTNYRLTENDIAAMKIISQYTSIVLLISKAETYEEEELKTFQAQVREAIKPYTQSGEIVLLDLECPVELPETSHYTWGAPYPVMGRNRTYRVNGQTHCVSCSDIEISATKILRKALYTLSRNQMPGSKHLKDIKRRQYSLKSFVSPTAWKNEIRTWFWDTTAYLLPLLLIACLAIPLIALTIVFTLGL